MTLATKPLWHSRIFWLSLVALILGLLTAGSEFAAQHNTGPWTTATWTALALVLFGVVNLWLRTATWEPLTGTPGAVAAQAYRDQPGTPLAGDRQSRL